MDKAIWNPLGCLGAKLFLKEDVVSADRILRSKWFRIYTETRQKAKPHLESRLVV